MPRPRRVVSPSIPLHVIQRGNNRSPCFHLQNDYLIYLDALRECAFDTGCAVHAYVLMSNHVHLLLSPDTTDSVSTMMQRLGQRYVQYFNRRHARTGTLWEGRFRSSPVQDERYFLICQRYIELNPVRANMVDVPADYPWSSHQTNAFGRENALITPHPAYLGLGKAAVLRQAAYRHLFNDALPEELLDEVRKAGNSNRPLGLAPNAMDTGML
ncbi:transposase [Massilia aerilata]|uniref:Transposase n=1 Tax=Massilia aerilata TaxID=453817 RepID=A0ABW0S445_9BURK